MSLAHHFATTASLIAHPSRALMLDALMGRAQLNGTELAVIASISKQTASHHLKRLCEANLIAMSKQGKQNFYTLKNQAVVDILEQLTLLQRAIQSNDVVSVNKPIVPVAHSQNTLQQLRVCYGHMAGQIAVDITTALVAGELLVISADQTQVKLTVKGDDWLQKLGINTQVYPITSPTCMDWTEQRLHLSGWLGHELLAKLIELNMLKPCNFEPRRLEMTRKGEQFFEDLF